MFTLVCSLPLFQAQPQAPTGNQPAWMPEAQFGVNSAISIASLIANIVQATKKPQNSSPSQQTLPMIDPSTVQPEQQRSVSQHRYQYNDEEDEDYKPRHSHRGRFSRRRENDDDEYAENDVDWKRYKIDKSNRKAKSTAPPKEHTEVTSSCKLDATKEPHTSSFVKDFTDDEEDSKIGSDSENGQDTTIDYDGSTKDNFDYQ